ncbi:MAG: DUF1269 domain-containing protein [Pseudomonadota bacterium]
MSNLVVIAFKDPARAFELRGRLVELQKEYLMEMEDVVVVTHEDDGKVKLHQAMNLTAMGAAGGSFWGLLIGLLFMHPLLGAVAGAAAGALSGRLTDIGVNDDFMRKLGEALAPGAAAVFVLVRKVTTDKVLERLADFSHSGTVVQTSLSKDTEAELRKIFDQAS